MKRLLIISLILLVSATLVWMTVWAASPGPGTSPTATPQPDEYSETVMAVNDAIYDQIQADRENTIFFWNQSISITYTTLSDDGEWAASILVPEDRKTGETPEKEPALVISALVDGEWQVWTPNRDGWLEMVENAPDELLSPEHKEVYKNMNVVAAVNIPTTALLGYLLPWDDGSQNQKYLTGSTCHDEYIPSENAHYAFDFARNGTMWDILAAKAGEVWVWNDNVPTCYEWTCAGQQEIGNYLVLRDTSTNPVTYQLYLHLKQDSIPDHIKVRGYPIAQGEYIGNVDNTGQSWGSHLHFQVQVPYISTDYYWGRSVDITFNDVSVNGGRPRIQNASYCMDFNFCDNPGDVCQTSQLYYTSQNIRAGSEDSTPPEGDLIKPQTGEIYADSLPLEAWAQDLGDPGRNPIGLMSAQFIAYYNGVWRDVGPAFNTSTFEYDWDWCADEVPDGPVSVALRLRDFRGNQTPGLPGLQHVTKQYDCNPQPQPPACQPASNQVALFSEINYQGDCKILGTGNYPNATYFGTVGDDRTQSMLVGSSVQAQLFTEASYMGRTETLRANDANLGENPTSSDTLTSLKVGTHTTAQAELPGLLNQFDLDNREANTTLATTVTAPYMDTLEGDTSGWVAAGLWHLSQTQSNSATHSWRYGRNDTNNYDTGGANSGSLTSPVITLPVSAQPYVLQFWYRYETESPYAHWDQRWVQISVDGGPFSNAYQLSDDPMSAWLKARFDLFSLYGSMDQPHTIQVRFYFQSIDGRNNDHEGWFIDDIQVQAEPVTGCPTDNQEVNDLPAQAAELGFNTPTTAAICPGWDFDYYKFIGLAGEHVIVDVDAKSVGSELDSYLFLLDSDGTSELAENDDEVLYELQDPLLSYILPRSGQYYLKLRAWDHPSGTGEYTIKMIHDEVNPIVQLTYPTENGGLTKGQLSLSVQASDAQSGMQSVQFWYHTSDWVTGKWIDLGTDTDGSDGWTAALDTRSFSEGTVLSVYAKATDRAGNWSPAAAWQVVIDSVPPAITLEPLVNPATSTALHLKWQATDNVSGIGSVTLEYRINGGSWQSWATVTGRTDTWFVGQPGNSYAFRATARDGAGNATLTGTVSSSVPAIGSLCSSPDAWDGSATTNDNSFSKATAIAVGGNAQVHNFCNPAADGPFNDQDWLYFTAEAGNEYLFLANPQGSSAAVKIRFYAANGTTLLAETSPTTFGQASALIWRAKQNETIYVQLLHTDGNVAGNGTSYRVSLADQFVFLPLINR